jgi:hypothetical protein
MDLIPEPSQKVSLRYLPLIHWPISIFFVAVATFLSAIPLANALEETALIIGTVITIAAAAAATIYYPEECDTSVKSHFLDTPERRVQLMAHNSHHCTQYQVRVSNVKDLLTLSLLEIPKGGSEKTLETVSVEDADGEGRPRAIECKLDLETRRRDLQMVAHSELLADLELEDRGKQVAREIEAITV